MSNSNGLWVRSETIQPSPPRERLVEFFAYEQIGSAVMDSKAVLRAEFGARTRRLRFRRLPSPAARA